MGISSTFESIFYGYREILPFVYISFSWKVALIKTYEDYGCISLNLFVVLEKYFQMKALQEHLYKQWKVH